MTENDPEQPQTDGVSSQNDGDAAPRRRGLGRAVRRILILFVVLTVATGGGAAWLFHWADGVYRGPGPLAREMTVVIESGSGLQSIAGDLEDAGVIEYPQVFIAMLRYSGEHTQLKAGEYAFDPGVSQAEVADKLVAHSVVERFLTVPEGLTVAEVLQIVAESNGLTGTVPSPPPEGSLLPETYQYRRGDNRGDIVERMRKAMTETVSALWESRADNLPFTSPADALTMASIVEKETGVASERQRVAGVFVNRLRRGMRLQSDPTVVYALTGGQGPLGRALTRQDWKIDNPYNTYRTDGLPPGPIANPGREALAATLNPASSKELYFVADGSGGHAFAETLAQHNRNVAKWRKIRDQGN